MYLIYRQDLRKRNDRYMGRYPTVALARARVRRENERELARHGGPVAPDGLPTPLWYCVPNNYGRADG